MMYKKGMFIIDSDFDIRTIREEDCDIDLFLPIDNRTINLDLGNAPEYLYSRLQFPMVRNIIIRFSLSEKNNISTVHILRNIDIQSAIANFEIDYTKHYIEVKDREYFIEMRILEK